MEAILYCAILNSAILDSAILIKTLIPTNSIWLKVIHSDSSWWRQPSWILPFCTKETSNSLILTQCDEGSHIDFCHLGFIHFAQKKIHSFILTQLDDGSHLEFCQLEFHHLGFSHNSFSSQSHSHLPILVPTICTKKLHSFILTQLDDGSHLECCHGGFRHCHLGFRHLVFFSRIHSKTLSLHPDSDSN